MRLVSLMNNVILGHNPLFGVNHHSQKQGIQKALAFQDPKNINNFLDIAYEKGYRNMMLSTHPNAIQFLNNVRKTELKNQINFYPLLPYMQKYVRKSNEGGILKMVSDLFKTTGTFRGISLMAKAGFSGLSQNTETLIKTAVQIEFDNFKQLKCERVFLHNAITDLLIGLDMRDPILIFLDFVTNEIGAKAGFGTLNLPYAIKKFNEWGLNDQYFMAPFNKNGHQMNPNLKDNVDSLKANKDVKVLAMSTLASGTISVDEAFSFLKTINNIDSIVVGISNPKHLSSTMESFKKIK